MSKFVDEIIEDIRKNPSEWTKTKGGTVYSCGIKKQRVEVNNIGNSVLFSIADVIVDTQLMPLTKSDSRRLERVVKWWYQNANLEQLKLL